MMKFGEFFEVITLPTGNCRREVLGASSPLEGEGLWDVNFCMCR